MVSAEYALALGLGASQEYLRRKQRRRHQDSNTALKGF